MLIEKLRYNLWEIDSLLGDYVIFILKNNLQMSLHHLLILIAQTNKSIEQTFISTAKQ